jgi:voltage-gated potassium channel
MKKEKSSKYWWLISPTYKYAEQKKFELREGNASKEVIANALRKYNKRYFIASIVFAIAAQLLVFLGDYFYSPGGFYSNQYMKWIFGISVLIMCWGYLFSRAVEICKAFLEDAIEKLNGDEPASDLKFGDRLYLSLKSYLELIINFGTIYYLVPACFFKGESGYDFESILESIYFSGVTITTLGYGDIYPSNFVLQFLTVFQVLVGFSLIVVAFAIYSNLALSKITNQKKDAESTEK